MTRGVFYTHDLETTPLQIKTDSAAGSKEKVFVRFYTADEKYSGGVYLYFYDPPQYWIGWCSSATTNFRVALPAEQTKIWTITETATSVKISCNEVDVLTYTFSDSSRTDECVLNWNRDTVKMKFITSEDTASNQFRAGMSCR